ncbi:MAG: hypothetical protein HYU31_13960 [Deltaproteobacteria bacterium]|nr:hypothetical protein [Deltaproteobacteria bacterium]MBI2181910.1 hypothetical protein [Deltaproteobacteria bacterium]MBI2364658.1 hypothetical protein [Deltaproteobacteria bacterium]MBI2534463.1 hypothetical protein [Deltaproteobacteria bacterium]MBI3064088.1 hypothetical protein [Deltaproteobacteria bacterium]
MKNSRGTMATNDQFIKTKPKLMRGFMRALLKALRLVKQNREMAMDAMRIPEICSQKGKN